jgi:hypothetical protein
MQFWTCELEMKGCVWHVVSSCVFRYPMVLLTCLSLCCGPRKWRNQWMCSLSWPTHKWNKAESMLWRLCSSIAALSACRTRSKSSWKLQQPTGVVGHQRCRTKWWVEILVTLNVQTAVCRVMPNKLVGRVHMFWSRLLLSYSVYKRKSHRDRCFFFFSYSVLFGFSLFTFLLSSLTSALTW